MTKTLVACVLIGALTAASRPAVLADDATGGPYRWNQYQVELPRAGWKVVGDALDDKGNKVLSLQTGDNFLAMFITLFLNAPAPDPQFLANPAGAAVAIGLPTALKLAGSEGESAIAVSYGSVDLSGGAAPLARITIYGGKEFWTLDTVVYLKGASMYAAMIIGKGVRGQIDSNASHQRSVAEAYGIFRSIRIVQK
jgi:hypothetical protein